MKPYIWSALHVHTHGNRNLDGLKAPFVAVGNHSSHLDAPLIMGGLPRRLSRNLAAGAAADYFFDKWYTATATALFFNAFPVDRKGLRNRKGLAGVLLNEGVPLLLFPEGTRSRTGAMSNFKPGAAALSISRNVPILPIALVGVFAAMPYGAKTPVPGRPEVHIVFGRPLKAAPGEIAHQFSDRLYRYVVEMHDTTARAHGMPTQADFHRAVALRQAAARMDASKTNTVPAEESPDEAPEASSAG
ncbi:MAG: 1-acyl-sn-glycerol-3-phosphate acyltransferase [Micropruina sp.]|nr:1-acyl-sn-glycerol-3-phosphate acyltransferase [Micropruina sp.]